MSSTTPRPTAHAIRATGLARVSGEHLEAANEAAIPLDAYSYARNSVMAAHFPELLEAERAARRVIPQVEGDES